MAEALVDSTSEELLSSLKRQLRSDTHNLIAFVGAGMSRQAGLPLWKELMANMDREVERFRPRPPHVRQAVLDPWQAEIFRLELERNAVYERFLRREFGKRLPNGLDVFRNLVNVGFRHFITTNYDSFIEQALAEDGRDFEELDWTDRQECRSFFLDSLLTRGNPFVIHVHGQAGYPKSIVLTHRDYVQRYVQTAEYVEKLSVMFATMRVVFIGFSLDDPDLRYILRQVNTRFGTGDVQHFALAGLSAPEQVQVERERMERQFGIASVFYNPADGHAALKDVLGELVRQPSIMLTESAVPAASTVNSTTPAPAVTWNDDPNKGKFGGSPINAQQTRRLTAVNVRRVRATLHEFDVICEPFNNGPPIEGTVVFHLHPTFPWPIIERKAKDGQASVHLTGYGAFTVGVECDNGRTVLELDLADDESFPADFRAV